MQDRGQLAGAEVGAEVAADLADRVDDLLADLLRDLGELLVGAVAEVGRARDRIEERLALRVVVWLGLVGHWATRDCGTHPARI